MDLKLAELCGIIAGDGHLSRYISKERTDYKLSIWGNKDLDVEYFKELQNIFADLVKIKPKLIIKSNCCELRINSKKIVEHFESLGIPVGKKSKIVSMMPSVKNNLQLSCAFLRGFADTDFSIVFKVRKNALFYPRITTDIESIHLVKDICFVLDQLGIKYCGPYTRNRIRNRNAYTSYQIDINGHKNFDLWMKNIGFRNHKHLNKIKKWSLSPKSPRSRTRTGDFE